MSRILIVDDSEIMCNLLSTVIKNLGHEVHAAKTIQKGLSLVADWDYEVIFLDVGLPDGNGIDYIAQLRDGKSSPDVIIITGNANHEGAELAIKSGAWDYVEKGATIQTITLPLMRVLQYRSEKQKPKTLALKREGIVGNSPKIRACLNQVACAACSDTNVLLTGESGTGKELFAWAIHANSGRAANHFVVVDCAALPETLVESLLFGHEKGAFTGANQTKEGLILQANHGTLFLDEIGELPMPIQKAFLRVLQERRFRPVGGRLELESDFRLIAATNKDLDAMVEQGTFRQDLLFRLRGFHINLPPLRERKEDIPDIVLYRLNRFIEGHRDGMKSFSQDFLEALKTYFWPGNVRELIHAVDRAIQVAGSETRLYPQHLPDHIRIQLAQKNFRFEKDTMEVKKKIPSIDALPSLDEYRNQKEKEYVQMLFALTKGNIKEACQLAGMSRSGLYRIFQKHNIHLDEKA